MIPPDNFQEDPKPAVAHRTSPTNLGLYLLSTIAARDFGWADATATVERLEAALGTMQRMRKLKGHFYNWYDTRDLRVLDPAYVSSVDSGNLAGHLIVSGERLRRLATAASRRRGGPVRAARHAFARAGGGRGAAERIAQRGGGAAGRDRRPAWQRAAAREPVAGAVTAGPKGRDRR